MRKNYSVMSEPGGLEKLEGMMTSLGMEVLSAHAGSDDGQFPILDLLRNLRDVAGQHPALEEFCAELEAGRERMVAIVKRAEPFGYADIMWLRGLLDRLRVLLGLKVTSAVPAPAHAGAKGDSDLPAGETSDDEIDGPVRLNLETDKELLLDFSTEIREHLDNIEEGMLTLEAKPDDRETLDKVFRAFHTTKGSAGFLNLVPINRLAHVLESLLELARQNKLPIDKRAIDVILRGRDTLKIFQYQIDERLAGKMLDQPISLSTLELRRDVQALIDSVQPRGKQSKGRHGAPATVPSDADPAGEPGPIHEAVSVLVPTGSPAPLDVKLGAASPDEPTGVASRVERNTVVKVDTGKLDALLDLIGEMVISQAQVSASLTGLSQQDPLCARQVVQLARITKELQRVSMSMRMVPIRGAFHRMARLVRDLGAKHGKRVQLQTDGEGTELDRGVVEQLYDPLMHIIRNSMDHGIEAPDDRVAMGKPAMGTINLRAYHQGGNIVIEVSDDGSGLKKDRIRAKALDLGLADANAALTDEEIFSFIFNPGFSTAHTVTDLSGRGVGLDVVKRNVENLRGTVNVSSAEGKGARFTLSLPLTLAIINGLVLRVGAEQYIVPSVSVRESFRPEPGMITTIQGHGEVANVRGRLIPVMRLYDRFGIEPTSMDPTACIGVVIESGANSRCLLVDALVTQQEVVIKNLNDLMAHKSRFLAGAAILGDGRVGLILDVNSLVHPETKSFLKTA